MSHTITSLFPLHQQQLPLEGIFLQHALQQRSMLQRPFVYTDYIVSLDGRIAVADQAGGYKIPATITNARDWRLYQELAAQADVLITSARYIRQLAVKSAQDMLPLSNDPLYADLHVWRQKQGLPPQPAVVILSSGNDLPLAEVFEQFERPVYVATGRENIDTLQRVIKGTAAKILTVGEGKHVDGKQLIDTLTAEGFHSIYSIAGPQVLNTLLQANVLDRLYLSQMHRLIGGVAYNTILESDLTRPTDVRLFELYYDSHAIDDVGQIISVYDVVKSR